MRTALGVAGLLLTVVVTSGSPVMAQEGAAGGQWHTYGGDLGHTRYAPLDQITAANFNDLELAWRFKTDNLGPTPEFRFQSTPLVVDGILYSTGGSRRAVVALDAGTGELNWVFSLDEGARGAAAPRQLSGRGLAYWNGGPDGEPDRIIYVTDARQMQHFEMILCVLLFLVWNYAQRVGPMGLGPGPGRAAGVGLGGALPSAI